MTRPSYDPMRAPAPAFPRHRFQRVLEDDAVNELAAAYDRLDYAGRVRLARAVASAPDEKLTELADQLRGAPEETPAPTEPVPPTEPTAPAVNQTAAQATDAPPAPGATPTDLTTPVAEQPAPPPAPPTIPPPDQLPQLKVPELQAVAEQVGVPKTGTKAELVDRIAAATGETPAITPEQVAADAASSPQSAPDASAQPETPAAPAPGADAPQVAPATPGDTAGTPTTNGATP